LAGQRTIQLNLFIVIEPISRAAIWFHVVIKDMSFNDSSRSRTYRFSIGTNSRCCGPV
jgi:hypothetical protein